MTNAKVVFPDLKSQLVFVLIGMGTMARGWAAMLLVAGMKVVMTDTNEKQRTEGLQAVEKFVSWLHKKGKLMPETAGMEPGAIMENLTVVETLGETPKDADVAFEIIIEDPKAKATLFNDMNEHFGPNTIYLSNTSGITTIGEISGRENLTLTAHGMNPVHMTKGVEIVSFEGTDPLVTQFIHNLLRDRLGKTTFNAPNIPGFLVNHLGIPFWLHSVEMIVRHNMEVIDIDTGLRSSLGYPQGSLLLQDRIGLDVMVLVSDDIHTALTEMGYPAEYIAKYTVPNLLREMVNEGDKGFKSGKGFYDWTDSRNPVPRTREDLMGL